MSQIPVAVFVGATSGIGRGMVQAFAHYFNGNAHIIIIGRNKDAAAQIINSFPKPTTTPESASSSTLVQSVHEFIASDVSLISNVHKLTKDLLKRLPRIDYLVLSPGVLVFVGRKETKEGLDEKMALSYYSRWTIINELRPLLRKAEIRGGARVYSVLAAGMGDPAKIDLEDLELKKNHTIARCMIAIQTYTDLMMQKLSSEEPSISFSHAYPGIVRTPMMSSSRWWLTIIYYLFYPVISLFSLTSEAAGKVHMAACMASPPGFNSYGEMGQSLAYTPADEEIVERIWKHTVDVTDVRRTM
ncbi:hypothetical protein D9757_007126 [Collybiopsis confluens]|uniref:NAD(P)-binding protein n=1 Tax=Collybiopsis confluens TaxID=2823264 RepID=A0A8H5HCI1_9AGAR|nr:hypothetical protein D9757_007126 [Collybiopsis confluens]